MSLDTLFIKCSVVLSRKIEIQMSNDIWSLNTIASCVKSGETCCHSDFDSEDATQWISASSETYSTKDTESSAKARHMQKSYDRVSQYYFQIMTKSNDSEYFISCSWSYWMTQISENDCGYWTVTWCSKCVSNLEPSMIYYIIYVHILFQCQRRQRVNSIIDVRKRN